MRMNPLLNMQHLVFLFGAALLGVCVLILGIYLLQKFLRPSLKLEEAPRVKVRVEDEAAFSLETVKSVIAQLKTEQKTLQEKLVEAERRAEMNARKFDLLAREIDYGLITFDDQGMITFSNSLVREVLGVDTWSRRRFTEIFRDFPELSRLIGECIETGAETRSTPCKLAQSDGTVLGVEVSVLATCDRRGARDVVACLFREPRVG
jgi:PAS domain-containing protein